MKLSMKKLSIIAFANFLVALGIYYFWVPVNLAPGGSTGLTVIIHNIFPSLPTSVTIGLINGVLLIIGFIFLGREFGGLTILSSVLLSVYIRIFEVFYPANEPVVTSIMLSLITGAIVIGVGIGLVFNNNASTGGTDIIAAILNKYFHISLGNGVMLADAAITLLATLILGLEIGLYSILGIIINSLVIDKIIAGFTTKIEMKIITKKFDEVNTFLNKEIGRGTTIYHAEGGFSYTEKKVIHTVLSRPQYVKAKLFLRKVDPTAFVSMSHVNEVVGEGFTFEKLM